MVEKLGRRAIALEADVTNEVQLQAAFDRVEAELGRLTISYANAGVAGGGDYGDIRDTTLETWNRVIGVNLTGVFLTLRESVRKMLPAWLRQDHLDGVHLRLCRCVDRGQFRLYRGQGRRRESHAHPGRLVGWQRCSSERHRPRLCAHEYRARRRSFRVRGGARKQGCRTADRIPMGAFAMPDDLKGLAVFLASPSSDYCTGFTYPIDGGWLAS